MGTAVFHSKKGSLFVRDIQEGEPERIQEPFVGKILGEKSRDSEVGEETFNHSRRIQGESLLVKQLSDSSPDIPDHDTLEIRGEKDCLK